MKGNWIKSIYFKHLNGIIKCLTIYGHDQEMEKKRQQFVAVPLQITYTYTPWKHLYANKYLNNS